MPYYYNTKLFQNSNSSMSVHKLCFVVASAGFDEGDTTTQHPTTDGRVLFSPPFLSRQSNDVLLCTPCRVIWRQPLSCLKITTIKGHTVVAQTFPPNPFSYALFVAPQPAGKPRWFMDLNPKGEVPVIVVDGKPIVGSEETVDYLMQGELDPEEHRAISSRWRAVVNDRLKPSGKRAVFSSGSAADLASLNTVLEELDACLVDGSQHDGSSGGEGPFVCGTTFTAADASAFPFLQRVHGEFGFPSGCQRLEAWYASASRRPGVRKTIKTNFWWWW